MLHEPRWTELRGMLDLPSENSGEDCLNPGRVQLYSWSLTDWIKGAIRPF